MFYLPLKLTETYFKVFNDSVEVNYILVIKIQEQNFMSSKLYISNLHAYLHN